MTAGTEPRRRRALVVAAVLCLIAALAVAAYGWKHEHDRASAQERAALARGLALHAAELRESDPGKAADIGAAAIAVNNDELTRRGLVDSVLRNRREPLTDPMYANQSVALSADGRIALAEDAGGVGVWDLTTWLRPEDGDGDGDDAAGRLALLKGHRKEVSAVALAADGRTALTGDESGAILVWDLARPARPVRAATLAKGGKGGGIRTLALSGDTRLAVAGDDDGRVRVWDLSDRFRPARLPDIPIGAGGVEELALSADGRTATVVADAGSGVSTTIWDLTDPGRPVKAAAPAFTGPAAAMDMSADGRTALLADLMRLDAWEIRDPSYPHQVGVVTDVDVTEIALASDGRLAFVAGDSGEGVLLDLSRLSSPVRVATLSGETENIGDVALSGDGRVALMSSWDGGVQFWDLTGLAGLAAHPLDEYCDIRRPELTWEEWSRLTGGADWEPFGGYGTVAMYPCHAHSGP
ncbi:WD-40 repeat protein [[Actinomadura] parvosata subsp. kistnae]|uniref:WD40 repeat domain-containing protein n=1 Tax=[Actinomadura] parvosata TaxID=1955412 RepID=UPI000D27C9FD|nr:hypothetical protein [Nonomuraea sp. ATCC 55076]SPL96465.1 WD-40 repeat protein [Actinomadura parvosata subsp. kistnae]